MTDKDTFFALSPELSENAVIKRGMYAWEITSSERACFAQIVKYLTYYGKDVMWH